MNQVFPVNFQGVQEGADPKALPPGTMLSAKNCRMDKARRLRKRGGIRPLATTGFTDDNGLRLFEAGDGAVGVVGSKHAWVYSTQRTRWQKVDRIAPFGLSRRPLIDSFKGVACVDIALSGNMLVTVWMAADSRYNSATVTGQPVFVQVQDIRTWDLVLEPTLVGSSGLFPKVVILGTTAHIFYMSAAGQLITNQLSLTTFAVSGALQTYAGYVALSMFDVDQDGTNVFTIGELAAGANRIEVRRLNATTHATVASATLGGAPGTGGVVCIDCRPSTIGSKGQVLVSWAATGASRVATLTASTLATVTGPTTFAAATSPTQVFALYDENNDEILAGHVSLGVQTETLAYATHATTAWTTRQTRDVFCVSRPFVVNTGTGNRWYTSGLVRSRDENYELSPPSRVLIELRIDAVIGDEPTHRHAATLENNTGWAFQAGSEGYMPKSVYDATNDQAFVTSTFRHREGKYLDLVDIGANLNILTAKPGDIFRPLRAGNTTLLTGPVPLCFDLVNAQPYGFAHAPQIVSTTPGGGGSGAMAAGTYQYQACYVRVGPDGIKQRSPMSDIVSEAAVATGSIAVVFDTSVLSCKLDEDDFASHLLYANFPFQVFIEIYRTTVDDDTLHRLTVMPAFNVVQSNPLVSTVTFTDTRADADITATPSAPLRLDAQAHPYSETELDDVPPPGSITGTVHRDRFAVVDSTGFNVWLSKKAGDDITIAPGFNEQLLLSFARKKTALASIDEKLIAWDADGIEVVHGDGPDPAGGGASWEVARVQSDVGCENPKSVVATPMGALFQSRSGELQILSRDLAVSRIGKAVEDTLADFPYITSAVLVEKHHEVRFTCNSVDYGEDVLFDDGEIIGHGIVLAWDYLHNIWFVREYRANDNLVTSVPFVDAMVIDGTYYMLDPLGVVYKEEFTHCFDYSSAGAARWVERDIQMAPMSISGSGLGWHRVKDVTILGTAITPHVLEVSAEQDFDELDGGGYSQVETFAESDDATAVGATNKARVTFAEQKCQALSLRIRDLTPASLVGHTGEGPILEALMYRAHVKRGPVRVSDEESK